MVTLEQCVAELLLLSRSGEMVTNAQIDDLVDSYLIEFGSQTHDRRAELATAFKEHAHVSKLSEDVFYRILRIV